MMRRGRLLVLSFLIVLTAAAVNWLATGPGVPGISADETSEPELEEFVPSETVPADTAVPFPVDI